MTTQNKDVIIINEKEKRELFDAIRTKLTEIEAIALPEQDGEQVLEYIRKMAIAFTSIGNMCWSRYLEEKENE